MRPSLLNPLFAEITTLKGIGDKVAKIYTKLLRPQAAANMHARVVDLLLHVPRGLVDRRFRCKIVQLPESGIVTLDVMIGQYKAPPRGRNIPYRVTVTDETGEMTLVYFKAYADSMLRMFPVGERRFVSGEIGWFGAKPQMNHPDYVVSAEDFAKMPELEPVYPMTEGLSPRPLMKAMAQARALLPKLPEWQDASWLARNQWTDFQSSLLALHAPPSPAPIAPDSPQRLRLAYDELLANQLALSLVRANLKRASGVEVRGTGALRQKIMAALPYKPTGAQVTASEEILADLAAPHRMIRLLQGDVGAGKTLVALMAITACVEAGQQAALMVPTEILARQHLISFEKLAVTHGMRVALLTGREKGRARDEILQQLLDGEIDLLIGTHALFQDGVDFKSLALAVIDEQHRFGVHQRMALQAKSGGGVNLLVMTATPIPRTLALTVYGDMDVSKLNEKPPGRKPIDTRTMPSSRIDEIIGGLKRALSTGTRAYWVCPLVEESELVDLANAEQRFKVLDEIYPGQVGLIHGRLKGAEKDAVMARFKSGALSILVSTTVIEVGVDVPEAAIMIIENAERFGLAQLHQLRGRVGRGAAKSSCVLIYDEPLGEVAKARLNIMRETEDGFRIAEEDLRLRGAGEMLGTAQSGLPLFRLADLSVHGELLAAARDDASMILAKDPKLKSERGEALRHLLYLFERDEAIRLLGAG